MAIRATLFLNLPVRDLERTKQFFATLGFEFDHRFEDDASACLLLGNGASAMLMTEARFRDFSPRELPNLAQRASAIFALELPSRADVDRIADKAVELGGAQAMPPYEMGGFMYGRSFYDLEGHHWEVFFMDEAGFAKSRAQEAGPSVH